MVREGSTIHYEKYDHGIKICAGVFDMVSEEDLGKIYELIQEEILSDFIEGCSLNQTIDKNVMIDMNITSFSNSDWVYEKKHKEYKISFPLKRR